ncbi:preprotein translocase subunit Sec61beta [Candidatus Woesearchaeota archaeon]|nr:MAG: preprotein translocase subunit Sec61beta [Candidatus Woesearchaeota archaeon]
MARDRVTMPSGIGGLVRYFDDYKSKIEFQPGHIIVLICLVMLILIILYTFGNGWLGL